MEKEKQIENIENIVDVILPIMKDGEFSARNLARALNKSGYGNVKEALKEFAERVKMAFYYEFEELIRPRTWAGSRERRQGMIIINRKMQVTETVKGNFAQTQASINSDGRITLRNYNSYDKDADEIMILSDTETRAIFDLMRVMKGLGVKNEDIPF